MNNAQLKLKHACSANEVNNPDFKGDKKDVAKLIFQQVPTVTGKIL